MLVFFLEKTLTSRSSSVTGFDGHGLGCPNETVSLIYTELDSTSVLSYEMIERSCLVTFRYVYLAYQTCRPHLIGLGQQCGTASEYTEVE